MRTASGTRSSALLLAVLVYVTLDLSLAVMPGAFVFDPGDSIESIHAARARTAAELPTLPGPARQGLVPLKPPVELRDRPAVVPHGQRRPHASSVARHRPPDDAAPAPEDPH